MVPVHPGQHRAVQFFCRCIDSAGSLIKTGIQARAQTDFSGLRDWGKGNTHSIPRSTESSPPAAQLSQAMVISPATRDKEGVEGACLPPETSQPKTIGRCQVAPKGAPAEKAKRNPRPAHSPGRRARGAAHRSRSAAPRLATTGKGRRQQERLPMLCLARGRRPPSVGFSHCAAEVQDTPSPALSLGPAQKQRPVLQDRDRGAGLT